MKASNILTLVAVLAGGASGYYAYDSWVKYAGSPFDETTRNPGKYAFNPTSTKASRAPLVPTRKSRESRLKVETGMLADETKALEDLTMERNRLQEENEKLASGNTELLAAKTELQGKVTNRERTVRDQDDEIRKLEEALAGLGNPDELKQRVQDNIRRLNEANAALGVEKDKLAAALSRKESVETSLAGAREKERMQMSGEMDPGFKSSVREVFDRWGFLVINAGAAQGVNAKSRLAVVRGGQGIAELQVTTVEPSVAVCAVVAGSLAEGTRIAPGDSVRVSKQAVKSPGPVVEEIPGNEDVPPPANAGGVDPVGGGGAAGGLEPLNPDANAPEPIDPAGGAAGAAEDPF